MDQPPRIWQIPVATYHRMIDCGALGPDDHFELLEGYLVAKRPREVGPVGAAIAPLWEETRWAGSGAKPWPLPVDRYHRMIDRGVFDDVKRVELVQGVLIETSLHSKRHTRAVLRLSTLLAKALDDRQWTVRTQMALSLHSGEPEPDLAVVDRNEDDEAPRHPRTAALVVEVAVSSLRFHRDKAAEYARAAITEYWIVDVSRRRVEVYREPRDGAYTSRAMVAEDGVIRPVAFAEVEVRVADLMMPRGS